MAQHESETMTHTRAIWRDYARFYRVLGGIALVLIGVGIGRILFAGEDNGFSYSTNLYTEFVSIAVTIFIIDFLNRQRDERREIQRLLRDVGSQSNEAARSAIHELGQRDMLVGENGILKGAHLIFANLQDANLWSVNLSGANLDNANLEGAYLRKTDLRRASLRRANLQGANLKGANLEGIFMRQARIADVMCDSKTTLPDGTKWHADVDWQEFGATVR